MLGMPLGIDPALAQPLRDIDPNHLSVSRGSVVSGLEIQVDWQLDVSVAQQQSRSVRIHESKYIAVCLTLSLDCNINKLRLMVFF